MFAQSVEPALQIVTVKRRIDPGTALGLSVVAALAFFGIYMSIETKDITIFIAVSLLFIVSFGSNITHDRGYYIRYDYNTIYNRMHGYETLFIRRHPQITMRFDDIGSMSTGFENEGAFDRAFMPFDSIYLHHKDGSSPDIFLHGASFKDTALRDFLHFLCERRPDIFTQDVITFLQS
jgi:hypothetical protein